MLVACRLAGLSARFSTTTTQCPQPADLMLDMLILINPHMRNAHLPKAERYGGFGETSMTRPRINGPGPMIVTTTLRPLPRLRTRTRDPIGKLRCAATSPV